MKIALNGASGFVGRSLAEHFKDVVTIARDDDVPTIIKKIDGVDVVVNLAGAPIFKRWSSSYKQTILQSRLQCTKILVQAINQQAKEGGSVQHFISASAIGMYANDRRCDEDDYEEANDFLATVVRSWERAAQQCEVKMTLLRFGVVLGKDGGALKQMLTPFKLGVGGTIGNGSMVMSWIHKDDLIALMQHVVAHGLTGLFNATSPHPCSNARFTAALANALHVKAFLPVPPLLLKLRYGEGASVLLDSKEVLPKRALDSGFSFKYAEIDSALQQLLS